MRQIRLFFSRWIKAIFTSKPVVCAMVLSLSFFTIAADSSLESLSNNDETGSLSTLDPATETTVPTHTVVVGDTLWNVTYRLRPEGMPMAQAMDILYENNPQAFLEGDSTKLIEGSVVSFASIEVVNTPVDIVVLEENSTLIIPTIDSVEDTNVESELGSDIILEDAIIPTADVVEDAITELEPSSEPFQESIDVVFEPLLEVVEPTAPTPVEIESDVVLNQPINQPKNTELGSKTFSFDRLIDYLKTLDASDMSQLVAKLKQFPIDFWIFVGALLLAMAINRARKLDQINKADKVLDKSSTEQKPIEAELDGPSAESADEDVLDDSSEATNKDASKNNKSDQPSEELILPGVEELEAQFREDAEGNQSQANAFLDVDFEDDNMDIDPLQIKLDMASLCIEMGDIESAQAILEEIIGEADKQGKAKAREILNSIET